jgi:hypothetical protein
MQRETGGAALAGVCVLVAENEFLIAEEIERALAACGCADGCHSEVGARSALINARENVDRNGVSDRVRLLHDTIDAAYLARPEHYSGPWDYRGELYDIIGCLPAARTTRRNDACRGLEQLFSLFLPSFHSFRHR